MSHLAVEAFLNTRASFLAAYQIMNQENGATAYYGFQDRLGRWYIMKSVTAGANITYSYTAGEAAYSTAWAGKGLLTYADFKTTFSD